MQDFFAQTFYGNTVADWTLALAIAVGAFMAGKVAYWIFANLIGRATARTESKLDDFLLNTMDEPAVVIVTVLGLWVAVKTLTLPAGAEAFAWNATQAALVLAVTWMVSRLWGAFVQGVLTPLAQKSDTDLDDQLIPVVRRAGRAAIWILGVIVALNNAGYDVAALIAGLGIGGLALAMAAKDTVSNVFGGFTIFTDQPFSMGDRIVVSGFDGTVEEIGVRSTRLRKLDGRQVTIPNSRFADSPVENVTREPNRKVTLNLGLTYDTSHERVGRAIDILKEIVDEHAEHLVPETAKFAFNEFGASALNVMLIYYIAKEADILETQTSMNMRILERFNAEGLDFAFPTQTIYTIGGDKA